MRSQDPTHQDCLFLHRFFPKNIVLFRIFYSIFLLFNDCKVCCWCVPKAFAQDTDRAFSKISILKLILV